MHGLLRSRSRLTVFPLEDLTVVYTTHSSDGRRLGDTAVVGVLAPTGAHGDHLWRLAAEMFPGAPAGQAQARWILVQCVRARVVHCDRYGDLADADWSAELTRTVRLGALFANHEVLRTGRMTVG